MTRLSGHKTRNVFDRYNVVDDADERLAVTRIEEGQKRGLEGSSRVDEP